MAESDENTVFVGNRKPTMNYVLAVITQFNKGTKEVSIKARGRAISRAVDVAEYLRNKVMKDVQVKEVRIGTEALPGDDGGGNVSTIEIVIARTK